MSSTEGDLQYSAVIDTSAYDSALDGMVASAETASSQIASESAKINDLLTNVPEVNIDFLKSINGINEMKEGIGQAFAQIASVIRQNEDGINELNADYQRLTSEINKFQNIPSKHDYVQELKQQRKGVIELRDARKKAIEEAKETEKWLEKEKKSLIDSTRAKEGNATATVSLKRRIKELQEEAAMLAEAAQKEGKEVNQVSGRYAEIIQELGRLRDIRGDIQAAGSVFANDENKIAGVIQGLSGLSGAFSVAQGAIGLFGSENEKLNEIMLKVQSVMAITMGLQQVQQVLNKDSTFSLIMLNSVKRLFNKESQESAEILSDENAEIADNIQQTKEEIAVDKASAASETADTDATLANTGAQQANTNAQGANAVATEGATASQNAHTGAMVSGTIATKAMTAATKLLKGALIATGIGALVVLVGELVNVVMDLFSAEDEAVKKTEDLQKINEEAAKTYIQEKVALDDNIKMCKSFTGTKEQEKKKVDELNSKYGEALGYYDSLEKWEAVLRERGPAYCEMLRMKAVQQGLLNKYVEAYVEALEVAHKAENGEFDRSWYNPARWFGDSNEERRANMKAEADKEAQYWKEAMESQKADLEAFQKQNNFDVVHIDPKSKSAKGGKGDSFDPKKAAAEQKKLLDEYKKAVEQYMKDTSASISQAMIDGMSDGYYKEINALHKQMNDRKNAWQQQLLTLATTVRDNTKAVFMTQKGATEEKWAASDAGKRTVAQWAEELLKDDKIKANYQQGLTDIENLLTKGLADIRSKYMTQLTNEFGTYEQKEEQLYKQWVEKLSFISSAFPEFKDEAIKQMDEAFANLKTEDFKKTINWDVVFGNLEDSSVHSIQVMLGKVKTYFDKEGKNMSVEQIKIFQEAIDKMEDEVASRNPYSALHKSLGDIGDAKDAFVKATKEMEDAQKELTAASREYKEAFKAENDLRAKVNDAGRAEDVQKLMDAQRKLNDVERDYIGALANVGIAQMNLKLNDTPENRQALADATKTLTEAETARNSALTERNDVVAQMNDSALAEQCITLVSAQERLSKSETTLTKAREKNNKAEQNTLTARNKITKAYKTFASNLTAAGKAATSVGRNATNLARVFSKDVADGIEKALDCIDEVIDATSSVMSAIGDVGKTVAKDVTKTVDASGKAMEATAAGAATSISTVEKASVILTVISAALQVATAIANLLNNDAAHDKKIAEYQSKIDQLQWELDNVNAVKLKENVGDAFTKVSAIVDGTRAQVMRFYAYSGNAFIASRMESVAYRKAVERVADAYASVSYSADKALGEERFKSSRKQLEKMAEQQVLMRKQIEEEQAKKDKDDSKIQEYKNKMNELAVNMAELINGMLEEIIGGSAQDIASTLGDAFFDAVKSGENAMEAWRNKVNEIVADILKRMMVQKFLEEPLAKLFDTYKEKWFGKDGSFKGIDVVRDSMKSFASDMNQVGENFQTVMNEMPEDIKKMFVGDEERQASERGIATASQESVDENNARLTAIQGHTYTIVQGVNDLNGTANAMLDRLTAIEDNTGKTAEALDTVKTEVKRVKDAVEYITTQGITLKK